MTRVPKNLRSGQTFWESARYGGGQCFFPPFVCKDPFKCDSGSFWWFGQTTGVWTNVFFPRLFNSSCLFLFIYHLCLSLWSYFINVFSIFMLHCTVYHTECKLCRLSCEHNLKDVLEDLFSSLIFFIIYLVRLCVNSQYTMGFWWKILYFLIPEWSNDWK